MAQVAISPYLHPPHKNAANVLILGMEGIGKGILAKTMVDLPADYGLLCHTATNLDQIKDVARKSRIDFIILMLDASKRSSLENINNVLNYIDAAYFLGKACFVVGRRDSDYAFNENELIETAKVYKSPVFFTNLNQESDCAKCAESIVRLAGVAAGMVRNVSSLLLQQ